MHLTPLQKEKSIVLIEKLELVSIKTVRASNLQPPTTSGTKLHHNYKQWHTAHNRAGGDHK